MQNYLTGEHPQEKYFLTNLYATPLLYSLLGDFDFFQLIFFLGVHLCNYKDLRALVFD